MSKQRHGKSEITKWCLENIRENLNSQIVFEDLQKIIPYSCRQSELGRIIKKVFPGVRSQIQRNKEVWKRKVTIYIGIELDSQITDDNIKFPEIIVICLQAHCFVVGKKPGAIKMGFLTGNILNGNRIVAEVEFFEANRTFSLIVSGKNINLQSIGIHNAFELKKLALQQTIVTLKQLKFCQGIKATNLPNNTQETGFKQYILSCSGDENSSSPVYKSDNCKQVLSLFSFSSTVSCKNCTKISSILQGANLQETSKRELIVLNETDHNDFALILNKIFPSCSEDMKMFLHSQKTALERHPNGRRWDPDVIRTCLTLWCRSPKAFVDLKSSGFFVLPSTRILQYHKNCIKQSAGINKEILQWMKTEAKNKNIPDIGYKGGIILDEMSIQEDLQFSKTGGGITLVGFKETCVESKYIEKIITKKDELHLGTHALQFVFLGNTGFRFPFAHFPTTGASSLELYHLVWDAIKFLDLFGFHVTFLSTDGAQANRDLMNMLLPNNKENNSFTFKNIMKPSSSICFIMDISHVLKKIRNNVSKSGHFGKRHLSYHGQPIIWQHWKDAFKWDITTNPFPVHHKLTNDHLCLTSESKMRNHLAEEVLDENMLHLMKVYQKSLNDQSEVDGSVSFLKKTSKLIKIFRDKQPILQLTNAKLPILQDILGWFLDWEKSNMENKDIVNKEKSLLSHQTRQDISSCISGCLDYCSIHFSNSVSSINLSRLNSDVVENVFSQQRGLHNGCNSNPTYFDYCNTMNAILLGQSTLSKKSNTGGVGAEPLSFSRTVPLVSRKGKRKFNDISNMR